MIKGIDCFENKIIMQAYELGIFEKVKRIKEETNNIVIRKE